MTDEQVLAAAKSDPDVSRQPMLNFARRITAVKRLRWELELTQEAFAERYGIPVATVRDWEQGRLSPDATAQSYLKLIKTDPKKVAADARSRLARLGISINMTFGLAIAARLGRSRRRSSAGRLNLAGLVSARGRWC